MRHLDLFSGIGGFALAARRVGWNTVAFCEIDPYCQKVLAKHWPGVPIHSDVRELTGDAVGPVDIITGGFPCQDISSSGKRAGIEGERSGLWSEIARLVCEIRPQYAVMENVSALLSRGLGRVLGDLAEVGYDAEWHCIPACYVGAPHERERIWIVAYPAGVRWPEVVSREAAVSHAACDGWPPGDADSCRSAAERLSEMERLCGEPAILGGDDGTPNRVHRLRAIGNGIDYRIAEMIFRQLPHRER